MVYVIAQLTIHDRARYDRYAAGFMDVLRQFGGRLLVSDESPRVVEGTWRGDKIVVLSFADEASFEAWSSSDAYRTIAQDRIAGSEGPVLMVRGIERAPRPG
jgi:uncharacterized protein (DUF1330 family)